MLCRFVGSNYVEILILPDSDSGQSPLRCNYLSSRQATPGSSLPSMNSKAGAAAGGDVGHLVGIAQLLHSRSSCRRRR